MAALVDYFLHIEGVDGESPDQQYNGWIQVQAWQWAEENAGRWGARWRWWFWESRNEGLRISHGE